jgi:serine/threonine protein kinase
VSGNVGSGRPELGPGATIGGYRLEQRIGRGGMAVVYRATDQRLDRQVALKLLAPGLTRDNAFRTRFTRESRAAAAVDHPNILPVYDAGEAAGHLFIAMRYVGGGDVRGLLRQAGQLSPRRTSRIISQIASALDAAHATGLVHRDVKPANMLLDGGHSGHVYLTDFGVSKQVLADQLTVTGQIVGTLDYIAPEQLEGQLVDGRTDMYSLACTAFELLCGVPPFRRDLGPAIIFAHLSQEPPSVVARRIELPLAVDRVLARALAKSPAERYATCSQFAAQLSSSLGVAPDPADPPGQPFMPPLPGTDPASRGPWPVTRLATPVPPGPATARPPRPPGGEPPTRRREE